MDNHIDLVVIVKSVERISRINQKTFTRRAYTFFSFLNPRFWYVKPTLEKTRPKLINSYSDKPIALIRNIGSQPLQCGVTMSWVSKGKNTRVFVLFTKLWQNFDCPVRLIHTFAINIFLVMGALFVYLSKSWGSRFWKRGWTGNFRSKTEILK